jgi:MOSC domain-containing protein YiiM
MPAMSHGVVHSINVSDGGTPKLPRPWARVRKGGMEGDRQRDPRIHGGPDRAVSLYSLERIEALRAEGHPIAPGTIGENLTLAGLDWTRLAPGVRLQLGDVTLEITSAAGPCRNIAGAFRDGAFVRVSEKLHPGWSRFYSRVLAEGVVRTGDAVVLLEHGGGAAAGAR